MRAEDWTPYTPSFVIRTAGDPGALTAAVARTVRQVDARIPVSNVRTMDQIVEATGYPRDTVRVTLRRAKSAEGGEGR